MRSLYMATVAACVRPTPIPRSCKKSSTLLSESGNRTKSITAKRMISGLVLKYLNGECFVIRRGYETTLPVSSSFCLTVPSGLLDGTIWKRVRLACLSPKVQKAILNGTLNPEFTIRYLQSKRVPATWVEQDKLLISKVPC